MARFAWAVGGLTATLNLPRPLFFRAGTLGRVRTRYRSISLDQRTSVTELLTQTGADVVEGRLRFYTEPAELAAMIEDAASGALLTYEHSNGLTFADLLLEDAGNLTEIRPDEHRFGFGEWERTLRLRHVGNGANLLTSPEAFDDTVAWTHSANLNIIGTDRLAPDVTATADSVEDTSTTTIDDILQTVPDVAGRYLFSVFCRKLNSSDGFPGLVATVSESTATRNHTLNFDPDTGDFATIGSGGPSLLDSGVVDVGGVDGGWLYVFIVAEHDATASAPIWTFRPAHRATLTGAVDATRTGTQRIWGAQVVQLDDAWTAGNALPAYVPVSKRTLWQLFPPVKI